MRRVQVFDVDETPLDLAAMDPHFQRIFGDAGVRVAWFTQMIQSALVATVTGVCHPFSAHAMAALAMTAEQAGVELTDDDGAPAQAWPRAVPDGGRAARGGRRPGAADCRPRLGCGRRGPGGLCDRLRRSPRQGSRPLVERPGIIGADLTEVADAILAADGGATAPGPV
jgi:hypothetical protein